MVRTAYDVDVSGSVRIVDPASPPSMADVGTFSADLVVLPHDVEGNCGLYSDQLVTTVKALRADGIGSRPREWCMG